MNPIKVERVSKKEMDTAVLDLEIRGYELVGEPVHQVKEGKRFTHTNKKGRVAFEENIQDGKWLAKMRRVEMMNEKRIILSLAKKECIKNLAKLEDVIESLSGKLAVMDDDNSSVRIRANKRALLSTKCEERDRWFSRLDIINQWMKEIG